MTVDVELRELDVEVALNRQLRDLLSAMTQDLMAARNAGVDTTAYDHVYLQGEDAAAREDVPKVAQQTLDGTRVQDDALKSATAVQVAANEAAAAAAAAFQAARDNASYQRGRALDDLAHARAIPVLDVNGVAAALADLESRFPAAQTMDDFNNFGAAYAAQARTLENLLYSRANASSLLGSAEQQMAKAQGAGADVSADAGRIADLANQLAGASNLGAIQAIAGGLSQVIRDLVALYFEARSRPFQPAGAIIDNVPFSKQVYSLSCEAASLQMALAYYGVNVSQDQILAEMGEDRRPPMYDNGTLVWGDPYQTFVGNPNGYETANPGDPNSGYGTYWPTIKAAALAFLPGSVAQAGELDIARHHLRGRAQPAAGRSLGGLRLPTAGDALHAHLRRTNRHVRRPLGARCHHIRLGAGLSPHQQPPQPPRVDRRGHVCRRLFDVQQHGGDPPETRAVTGRVAR